MVSQKSKVRIKIGSFGKDGFWLVMEGSEVENLSEKQVEIICDGIRETATFVRENPNKSHRAVHSSSVRLFE